MDQPQATFALSCEQKDASPKPGRKFRDTKGTREKVIAHRGRAKLEMMPWPKVCTHKKFNHVLEYADSKTLPLPCPPLGVTTQDPATSLALSHEKPNKLGRDNALIVDTAARSTGLRISIIVTCMHENGRRMEGITMKTCDATGIYAAIRSSLKGQM